MEGFGALVRADFADRALTSGLNFAADFVEEIEDEADLAHRSSLS
jgi:hypothetical protein